LVGGFSGGEKTKPLGKASPGFFWGVVFFKDNKFFFFLKLRGGGGKGEF